MSKNQSAFDLSNIFELLFHVLISFPVPLAAPTEIKAVNSSSFCLNVTWIAIPANLARGVITKYRIYYKLQSSGATEQAVDSEPDQEHTVCGLEPYTEYVLKMSGFTSKGEGPVSSSYTPPVFTDEYSMYCSYW